MLGCLDHEPWLSGQDLSDGRGHGFRRSYCVNTQTDGADVVSVFLNKWLGVECDAALGHLQNLSFSLQSPATNL